MVSTTDFDSVSLGSSPSSPTNLTNMEEIEKINIINKRLRQKEARADWKWVNDGKQFGWARGRSKNRKSKRGYEVGTNEYDYSCVRGYAYAYEISADKSKFSIEEFSKAVERFNNPIPKPIVDDEDNCTVEERKALNEYYEYRRHNFHSLSYFYVSSDIKFANLSVGDDFYGEEIIAIDKKLGIVVTKENNEVNYYWVKDPNSKPSLYRRGTYNSLVL